MSPKSFIRRQIYLQTLYQAWTIITFENGGTPVSKPFDDTGLKYVE